MKRSNSMKMISQIRMRQKMKWKEMEILIKSAVQSSLLKNNQSDRFPQAATRITLTISIWTQMRILSSLFLKQTQVLTITSLTSLLRHSSRTLSPSEQPHSILKVHTQLLALTLALSRYAPCLTQMRMRASTLVMKTTSTHTEMGATAECKISK